MTVMTTTFIPCGAKLPIIALLMGSIIGDSSTTAAWISPLFYFLGVFAVIASGLMLKKTKLFAGRPTPFVMELPAYHFPAIRSWALHVWERCWAFIKKAGTVIFASTVVVWFLSNFGSYNGSFGFLPAMDGIPEEFMDYSVLAMLGNLIAWIFAPLGFSTWQATALSVSGSCRQGERRRHRRLAAVRCRCRRDRSEPVDRVRRHVPYHGRLRCLWRFQPAVRSVLCRYGYHPQPDGLRQVDRDCPRLRVRLCLGDRPVHQPVSTTCLCWDSLVSGRWWPSCCWLRCSSRSSVPCQSMHGPTRTRPTLLPLQFPLKSE